MNSNIKKKFFMKTLPRYLALGFLFYLALKLFWTQAPVELGKKAPLDTKVKSFDGKSWYLSELKKPMLINFWATWCPPCIQELPELVAAYKIFHEDVVFVGLSSDSPAQKVKEMAQRFSINYPLAQINARELNSWRAYSLPATYLISKNGNIIWHKTGATNLQELKYQLQKIKY